MQHVSLNPSIYSILWGNSPGFEPDMVIHEFLKPNIVAITETQLYNWIIGAEVSMPDNQIYQNYTQVRWSMAGESS